MYSDYTTRVLYESKCIVEARMKGRQVKAGASRETRKNKKGVDINEGLALM